MICEFKSNEGYANSYVICRFHECIIINPAHSYEEIIEYVGPRTLIGLFATEISKSTIDQVHYYNVPLYLSKDQEDELKNDLINGYKIRSEVSFTLDKLNVINYEDGRNIKIGGLALKFHVITGAIGAVTVFEFQDNLFVGSIFNNQKLIKKARYKSSIYDLKKSILKIINLPEGFNLYHSFREKNKLSTEKLTNIGIERWL